MHFWGVKIGLFSELGTGVERSVVDYVIEEREYEKGRTLSDSQSHDWYLRPCDSQGKSEPKIAQLYQD